MVWWKIKPIFNSNFLNFILLCSVKCHFICNKMRFTQAANSYLFGCYIMSFPLSSLGHYVTPHYYIICFVFHPNQPTLSDILTLQEWNVCCYLGGVRIKNWCKMWTWGSPVSHPLLHAMLYIFRLKWSGGWLLCFCNCYWLPSYFIIMFVMYATTIHQFWWYDGK